MAQKKKNERYLFELQKFLDTIDSIQDDSFKYCIVAQMNKIEDALTDVFTECLEKNLYDLNKEV